MRVSSGVAHVARFVALLALVSSGDAAAQTVIHVPADVATIQGAISQAVAGDVVLVAPGTYVENLTFQGKAITVESSDGPDLTIVDGGAEGSVVTFAGEGSGSVLRGFTLRNGASQYDGGGISVSSASPTIEGNVIAGNAACAGAGISIAFGSPVVRGNTIRDNTQAFCSGGTGGGGIEIRGAASAQILGNLIAGNSTGSDGGAISLWAAGTPTIRGNVIQGNAANGQGGAISMFNHSDAEISGNLIVGNSARQGGAIAWLVPSGARGPLVLNNTIVNNDASGEGSGIFADGFDRGAQIVNNIIVATTGQTAIHCGNFNDLNSPAIRSNDVVAGAPEKRYGGACADQTGIAGNLSVDPLFVDASAADFHLMLTSPTIDAGENAAATPLTRDLDETSRVLDGDDDCIAVVDLGAYEVFLAPSLALSDTVLSFADQLVGTESAPASVTVSNPGTAAVRMCGVLATGDFTQTSSCGTTLGAGASCTIEVEFAPVRVGPRTGSVTVTNVAANSPQRIALSGTGTEPPIIVSPASATVPPRGAESFGASGGSGTGFTWSLATNASGGSVDVHTGAYVAGPIGSVVDVVSVSDSFGGTAEVSVTVTAAVAVSPGSVTLPPRGVETFTASGGSGTGFSWSLLGNASGGSIDAESGAYLAGTTGGVTDVVEVVDSLGNSAQAIVSVSPAVAITPASATVPPGGLRTFKATGGSNSGFTWSLAANRSGGGIDAATGAYVAGATGGVTDLVEVVDSIGNAAVAIVTVSGAPVITPLLVNPNEASVPPRGRLTFGAAGGSGAGYTWSLAVNASGGSIDAYGNYVAGATGSVIDVVRVLDSSGASTTVAVSVTPALAVSPEALTVDPGGTHSFAATGGAAGYTWSLATNASGGSIGATTGIYVAGTRGGVSDVVRVMDAVGSTASAAVTVTAAQSANAVSGKGGGCSQGGADAWTVPLLAILLVARRRRRVA